MEQPKKRGNEENLRSFQWTKGQSGNPRGAKRKFVNVLKGMGYSLGEINDAIQGMLKMTPDDLEVYMHREGATVLDKIVAQSLLNAVSKGSLYNLETLMTRTYGAPKQTMEETVKHEYQVTLNLGDGRIIRPNNKLLETSNN